MKPLIFLLSTGVALSFVDSPDRNQGLRRLANESRYIANEALLKGEKMETLDKLKRTYIFKRGPWEIDYYDAKPFNNFGPEDSLILNNVLTNEFYGDNGVNGYQKGEKHWNANMKPGQDAALNIRDRVYRLLK